MSKLMCLRCVYPEDITIPAEDVVSVCRNPDLNQYEVFYRPKVKKVLKRLEVRDHGIPLDKMIGEVIPESIVSINFITQYHAFVYYLEEQD